MNSRMQNKIERLARKAADLYNSKTEEEKQELEELGTSMIYEEADSSLYSDILLNDDNDELFEELEDKFWDLVE